MLLEVSNKGASIDLDAIPRPDLKQNSISFDQWVRMYPGMGFILTVDEHHVAEVCSRFLEVGMTAHVIGTVDNGHKNIRITHKTESTLVFNFAENGIMRLFTGPDD